MENQNLSAYAQGFGGKFVKIGFLAATTVVLFLLTWWFINLLIYEQMRLVFWLGAVVLMALSISALTFFTLTASNRRWFWLINGVILAGYIGIFPKDIYVIAGGLVFFLLGLLFEQRVKAEENSRADFSIRRVMSTSITTIIYGFLLLLAFNIYYNTSADFKKNPDAFYDRLGNSTAAGVEKIDLNQTLDQFLTKQGVKDEREKQEIQREVLRQLGFSSQNNEPLSVIVSRAFTAKIKQAARPYEKLFPLIFTLVMIALLRTFAFLFRWLTVFLTWIWFRFLLRVKFFKIEKVPVEVNKLVI